MDWQVAYLKAAHAPITPQNLRFLNTWQRFEGGATNNDAANNYLNTTWGTGFKAINGVGVKAYPSLQVGAEAFANTLAGNRNYGGLLQGLRAGDPYKFGSRVSAGLETWVSGSPTGNPGYAQKILGTHTDAASSVPGLTETPAQPTDVSQPDLASTAFLNVGRRPTEQLSNLVAAVAAGGSPSPVTAPAAPSLPTPTEPRPAPVHEAAKVVSIPGTRYQVNQQVLPAVESIVSKFGVHVSSGYRDPARNAAVGGAPNSDHLRGNAVDFVGAPQQITALYRWAQKRFPYVEPMSQAKDHVHISFIR